MIVKEVTVQLTQAEIDSPEDIEMKIHLLGPGEGEGVTYTITYPKENSTRDPD